MSQPRPRLTPLSPPRERPTRRGGVPSQPTPLIGRDADLAALRDRLWRAETRLVTLIGPGGVGKTRLALALADLLAGAYADGTYFVDLAPLQDPDLVPAAIARALGLREGGAHPAATCLHELLRDKDVLLLLDNCEQIPGCAPAIGRLLTECPALVILATSRAPLRLRWEQRYPVHPLAVPDPDRAPTPAALATVPAVELFVDRARAVDPNFALTPANAPAVAALCAGLDGLPLAIEMAAARIGLLPPAELLARLQRRFSLLRSVAVDRPPRHQTIRETIAWSYDLLTPAEQALFRHLAVFAGGCTLDAADAVCAELKIENEKWKNEPRQTDDEANGEPFSIFNSPFSIPLLDALSALINNSLLHREEGEDGEVRFGMLESVREFGAEQLAASGEVEAVGRRHAAYFLTYAEEAERALVGPQQAAWLARLEQDFANLRAALDWWAAHGEAEAGLRLAGALARFWPAYGHVHEGRRWLTAAFADRQGGVAPPLRAKVLNAAADLAWMAGDFAASVALATEALALFRALGDRQGQMHALSLLGNALRQQGDRERGRECYEEELALGRALGDTRAQALALGNLGGLALDGRDLAAASGYYAESLALARRAGDARLQASALTFLGVLSVLQGEYQRVRALLDEGLTLIQALGNRRMLVLNLGGQAMLALVSRQSARATRLLGAAVAIRSAAGLPLYPAERPYQERMVGQARAALGDIAFDAAWAVGQAWTPAEVVEYALAEAAPESPAEVAPPPRPATVHAALTRREREILPLLARGLSNAQIADELSIGTRTVESHVARLFGKLGLGNRAQVAAWAAAHDLAGPESMRG